MIGCLNQFGFLIAMSAYSYMYTGTYLAGKQPRLLICSRSNECGQGEQKREGQGGAAYGIPTLLALGLQGKAEEVTVFSSQEEKGSYGSCYKCVYVCRCSV